jgi:hypothetical protein
MMSERKDQAREKFKEYVEEKLKQNLSNLSQVQQSLALTQFYIEKIHNFTKTEISEDDIEAGLVDGSGDLGVDFINRDDGRVLIIQSKYHSTKKTERPETISYFKNIIARLMDKNLKGNSKINEKLSEIDLENDTFDFIFLTFGEISNQAAQLVEHPPFYPDQYLDLPSRCNWEFLSEADITEEYRNARGLTRGIKETKITLSPFGKKGKNKQIIEINSDGLRSCIVVLKANQIVDAYNKLGKDALFSLNIRNFIGNTTTNKGIIKTAKEDPDHFFFFNNGVSCLCKEMEIFDDKIEATGLQVINGAQTVKALYKASLKRPGESDPWLSSIPFLLVRITEIPIGYGHSGKLKENITQYNNTQNIIKISDFRSNDSIQVDLVNKFKSINRSGKKVVYCPKRTDERPPNSEIIRLEEFSKIIYSFLEDPVSFAGSTSFLFDDGPNGGYNKIFGDGKQKWQSMPKDEFELRAAIYWLGIEFAEQIKLDRQEIDVDRKGALDRKFMIIFAAKKVLELAFPKDEWKTQMCKSFMGEWKIGEKTRGIWFKKIYHHAKLAVVNTYMMSKKTDPNFVHRNWMRSKQTLTQISNFLSDYMDTIEPIIPIP